MTGDFLQALEIRDFKCFEQLLVPLAPLTVMTGLNGAGKSTAIQPLLLLAQAARRQTWNCDAKFGDLPLNGEIVRLGTAGDVVRAGSANSEISFELSGYGKSLKVSAKAKSGARSLSVTNNGGESVAWPELQRVLSSRLVHLGAVRGGPKEAFPAPDHVLNQVRDVGVDGRFASHWYQELADTTIEPSRCHPKETADSFRKQVDAWLNCLAPGANANVISLSAVSMFALQFRTSEIGEWKQPANVGYGLTYAFPIIVALLAAEPGDVLVIDSPEAHLHPQAQSQMGRLLARVAAAGVQILVETHSDHVLNGLRLAVREQLLPPTTRSLSN